jgi:pSer/pThr/pTyr-binding forkhead associated (FHA) protein
VQQIADRGFSIQDQASANGTWVNDRKVDTATLSDGDIIMFGSKTLRFKGTPNEALIKPNPV